MAIVRKFLDLSTEHLTEEQRNFGGRDGDSASWGSALVDVTEDGFWMWVHEHPKEHAACTEEGLPDNLMAISLHARAHGCDYVLFDRDAECDPDLPVFEESAS
jgi:hypothetical protein